MNDLKFGAVSLLPAEEPAFVAYPEFVVEIEGQKPVSASLELDGREADFYPVGDDNKGYPDERFLGKIFETNADLAMDRQEAIWTHIYASEAFKQAEQLYNMYLNQTS